MIKSQFTLILICALFFTGILSGCSSEEQYIRDSNEYQYRLEHIRTINQAFKPIDLDGDGRDELAAIKKPGTDFSNGPGGGVDFKTQDRYSIGAFNVRGAVHKLLFFDWNNDGKKDVLVPSIRNDSLFIDVVAVNLVAKEVTSVETLFITAASDYPHAKLGHGWDPLIGDVYRIEGNGVKEDEFVVVITAGYAGAPRGILKFSLPEMKLIDRIEIGSPPGYNYLDDVDKDGVNELILSTSGTSNGFSANGLEDTRSYLVVFELDSLSIAWSKELGQRFAYPTLLQADLDGNGDFEYIQSIGTNDDGILSRRMRLVDFTGRGLTDGVTFDKRIERVATLNIDDDPYDEILVVDAGGTLHVFEGMLHPVRKEQLNVGFQTPNLEVLPDVDGDGKEEIVIHTVKGYLFLTPELKAKAFYSFADSKPRDGAKWGVMQTGRNTPPSLFVTSKDETVIFSLEKNGFYWWYRYSTLLTWGLWVMTVFVTSVVGLRYMALRKHLREDKELKKHHESLKGHVIDYLAQRTMNSIDVPFLEQVRQILNEHASEESFNVQQLAKQMGLGQRQAQRKIKSLTDMGPSELIWQFRVHRAAELLRHSGNEVTIAEVAYDVGFSEASHMSKRFKEVFGVTPTEYREAHDSKP